MRRPVRSTSAVFYQRVREILESARAGIARTVNTTHVIANWLIGREIVEEEQRGKAKAGYGERLLAELSARLTADFGHGYSVDNLELCRRFYLNYRQLISDAVCRKSIEVDISDAACRKSAMPPASAPASFPAPVWPRGSTPGRGIAAPIHGERRGADVGIRNPLTE